MKIPNVNTMDRAEKFVTVLNCILFLVMFVGLYLMARQFVHNFFLRILCLLADYFVTALVIYCIIRPLSARAAEAIRSIKR